jgi:UDP-glucose:(heptosyl)LPS alpha-1,3-glucosyltransferase
MKIALGIREFLPEKGGAERYCYDLMQYLADKGLEVHIYSAAFPERDRRLCFRQVPIIPHPKSLQVLSFALNCRQMMRKEQFDCIMGVGDTLYADLLQPHGGVHWRWFWRGLEGYRKPFPWIFKFIGRSLSFKQWAKGIIEDAPYAKAKKVIAISEMVRRDIVDYYGISEGRMTVIYNGVDTERFHPRNRRYREEIRSYYGLGSKDLLLLFVSHNFRLKGLRYLIQALALIKRKRENVKLLVIGRDRAEPYRRLAKKLGYGVDVLFAGGVRDLARYYASAGILVHPTFYDPCSLAVLEALASGLPVITTRRNGAGGIIEDGLEGFVLDDPRDVETLAEKILYLADPIRLKKTSAAARRLAVKFSQKRSYQKLLEAMKSIAAPHKSDRNYKGIKR